MDTNDQMPWARQAIDFMRKLDRSSIVFDDLGREAWNHASLSEILSRPEADLIVAGALSALVAKAEATMLESGRPTDVVRGKLVNLDGEVRLLVDSAQGNLRPIPLEPIIYGQISQRTHLPRAEAIVLLRGIGRALLAYPPKVWSYIRFKPAADASLDLRLLVD